MLYNERHVVGIIILLIGHTVAVEFQTRPERRRRSCDTDRGERDGRAPALSGKHQRDNYVAQKSRARRCRRCRAPVYSAPARPSGRTAIARRRNVEGRPAPTERPLLSPMITAATSQLIHNVENHPQDVDRRQKETWNITVGAVILGTAGTASPQRQLRKVKKADTNPRAKAAAAAERQAQGCWCGKNCLRIACESFRHSAVRFIGQSAGPRHFARTTRAGI